MDVARQIQRRDPLPDVRRHLGVPEDEATGAAAVRITDYLSRDLEIVQGKGSVISTEWSPEGWVRVAGRVVSDGTKQID